MVTDQEILKELSGASRYAGCAAGAPCAIVSAYREKARFDECILIDMAICQENMWLEATALGLGGVMLGIAPLEERMQVVEKALHIPAGLRAFSVFPLGYPAETRTQQDRWDESRIHTVQTHAADAV